MDNEGSVPQISEGNATKSIPYTAVTELRPGKLTFDESLVIHRMTSALTGSDRVRLGSPQNTVQKSSEDVHLKCISDELNCTQAELGVRGGASVCRTPQPYALRPEP